LLHYIVCGPCLQDAVNDENLVLSDARLRLHHSGAQPSANQVSNQSPWTVGHLSSPVNPTANYEVSAEQLDSDVLETRERCWQSSPHRRHTPCKTGCNRDDTLIDQPMR